MWVLWIGIVVLNLTGNWSRFKSEREAFRIIRTLGMKALFKLQTLLIQMQVLFLRSRFSFLRSMTEEPLFSSACISTSKSKVSREIQQTTGIIHLYQWHFQSACRDIFCRSTEMVSLTLFMFVSKCLESQASFWCVYL